MKTCIRCKETKVFFMFHSEATALYTQEYDVCKKCAKELKNEAVHNYQITNINKGR